MCSPHNAMPMPTRTIEAPNASTRSAAIKSAAPTANTPQRFTRSESQPAGYADSAYATFMTTSTAGT